MGHGIDDKIPFFDFIRPRAAIPEKRILNVVWLLRKRIESLKRIEAVQGSRDPSSCSAEEQVQREQGGRTSYNVYSKLEFLLEVWDFAILARCLSPISLQSPCFFRHIEAIYEQSSMGVGGKLPQSSEALGPSYQLRTSVISDLVRLVGPKYGQLINSADGFIT